MFGRRRDVQIPKTPNTGDKGVQNWMTAVSAMLNKYIGGGSDDRLVSAKELIDSGIVSTGQGGFLAPPVKNITKPPTVTGLTANGALASIFVQWVNPVFVNYAYTELWRSNVNDVGQAVLIARTAVESYTDNVGSAATKYYWARAVSDSGVKGDFSGSEGVKGQTSFDPEYIKQILTSLKWQPNTTYAPYQYIQPTTENGYQYMCIDGGQSASIEPNWPIVVGDAVNDGDAQWLCVAADARLPFVIGTLENGDPAVFIDTAFIKDATITSAKIGSLIADKIETGKLKADLQVKSKLWYGFSEFANSGQQSGFWIGIDGDGLPKVKFDTGLANGNRKIIFDGETLRIEKIDLVSSADGQFDDLAVDSLTANRVYATDLGFKSLFAVSEYVRLDSEGRPIIDVDTFDPRNYYCWIYGCQKNIYYATSPDNILFIGSNDFYGGIGLQVYQNNSIVPYDYPDATTKYRMKKKDISFAIKLTLPFLGFADPLFLLDSFIDFRVYLFDETMGFASNLIEGVKNNAYAGSYLAKLDLSYGSTDKENFRSSAGVSLFGVDISTQVSNGGHERILGEYYNLSPILEMLITCDSDNEALAYSLTKRLKVGVEIVIGYDHVFAREMKIDFMLIDKPINLTADSDSLNFTNYSLPLQLTAQEEAAVRELIRERINYREPL